MEKDQSCKENERTTCDINSREKHSGNESPQQECARGSGCVSCLELEKKLKEEQSRCNVLRANIHKVSANWFHRKTQLSESDMEHDAQAVSLLDETTKISSENAEEESSGTSKSSNDSGQSGKSKDIAKLVNIIAQKSAQLDLAEAHCTDLRKKMREYEKLIDNKEDVIHGLKEQLESYLNDNQKMSVQLNNLASLFQQIEKVDKETVASPQLPDPDTESASAVVPLPTQEEYQEMASSVSRTYIKLRDLVFEKKALVTEIERLNTLNVELQRRVLQQETRLMSVTDALHQTWLVVSDLKEQHTKLHNDELVFKYELKEKRDILTKLRKELESSRQQWQIIRQKNIESEQEYASIREMLEERKKALSEGAAITETEKEEPDEAVCLHPDDTKSFDPPVDLLLEMGLEYGIIGEEAEMTKTVLDVIKGEDVRNNRLEQLEEHCSLLYTKLIASTSRSLALASRLSRLHDQYRSSDDDEEGEYPALEEEQFENDSDESDDEDIEAEVPYLTDANQLIVMESVLSSSDSEEYDTAYVSETEGTEAPVESVTVVSDVPSTSTDHVMSVIPEDTSDIIDETNENCDHLSKTLINFLPKKIEYLREENEKLVQSMDALKEEKVSVEEHAKKMEKENGKLEEEMKILTKEMTIEKLQKRQLEEQLKHLGKCVDELKLKHDAEKKQSSKSKTEERQGDDEAETSEENRSDEEKKREANRLKKEVDLVKKEMEMKKKEKELKKREEELERKLKEKEEQGGNGKTGHLDSVSDVPSELVRCIRKPSKHLNIDCIFDFVIREVIPKLGRQNSSSSQDGKNIPENENSKTENGESSPKPEVADCPASSSESDRYYVTTTVVSQELAERNEMSLVEANKLLLIPVYLQSLEDKILCKLKPTKDTVLQIIQVTLPEISNSVPTTPDSATDDGSSSMTLFSSKLSSKADCSVLVPSSGLPSNQTSTVKLQAKRPVVCVIILCSPREEELQVAYAITKGTC